MSYEATFTKKCEGKEVEIGYFRCGARESCVAFELLNALNAPEEMYQHTSFPGVNVTTSKEIIGKALEHAKSNGPNYYMDDTPYYPVRDVFQKVFDSLSNDEEVRIYLF